MRVRLEVDPGTAGLNRFRVTLHDYDTMAPVAARSVSLRFRFLDDTEVSASTLELRPVASGVYGGDGGNLSLEGRWEVTVLVEKGLDSVEVPLEVATPCTARRLAQQGRATVYAIPVGRAGELQAYVAPGRSGHNDVHLTFFARDGGELRIPGRLQVEASRGDEERALSVRRFGPGHFVAGGQLDAGRWRFRVASARAAVRGCFEEVIRS
jgi:nitrogen fixation protein FixH